MFERAVQQLDQEGKVLATYRNATVAARSLGRTVACNISAVCAGRRKGGCYGYLWQYKPQPDLENETWKKHPQLNIRLSTLGRLENSKGRRTYGSKAKNGYRNYMEKGKSYGIHRLVFQTFSTKEFEVVHHKNRIRDDNRFENLEGCTQKENIQAYHSLIPKIY